MKKSSDLEPKKHDKFVLNEVSSHKKWGFPLKISSVIVTKFAVSCEFGHI